MLVGEHILIAAHGVGSPPAVDAAAVAGPRLGVAVGAPEPAQPDGEHDAARGGLIWRLFLLLLLLDIRPGGRRVHHGEVVRRELGTDKGRGAFSFSFPFLAAVHAAGGYGMNRQIPSLRASLTSPLNMPLS